MNRITAMLVVMATLLGCHAAAPPAPSSRVLSVVPLRPEDALMAHGSWQENAAKLRAEGLINDTSIKAAMAAKPAVQRFATGVAYTVTSQADFDAIRSKVTPADVLQVKVTGGTAAAPKLINVGAGPWNINFTCVGVTPYTGFTGSSPKGGKNIPVSTCFPFHLKTGVYAVTNLLWRGNNGLFWVDDGTAQPAFTGNDFSWGGDGDYYNRLAFFSGVGFLGDIVSNTFHDAPLSDRNLEIWGWVGHYSFNRFHIVNDGGHVMNPGVFTFEGNYADQLHRMMLEMQDPGTSGAIKLLNNTAFSWRNPYNDSFFLSVYPRNATNVEVAYNYANNDFTGAWGQMGPGIPNRFGIFIEAGSPGQYVHDNTMAGHNQWFTFASAGEKNVRIENNKLFGRTAEANAIESEPGFSGPGSIVSNVNNPQDTNADHAPPVPTADPRVPGSTAPQPVTFAFAATPSPDTTKVQFAFTNLPTGTLAVVVHAISTVGREPAPDARNTGTGSFNASYNANWQYDFSATALGTADAILANSNTIVGLRIGNPTTQPVTPPPVTDFHETLTIDRDFIGGKATNQTTTSTTRPVAAH